MKRLISILFALVMTSVFFIFGGYATPAYAQENPHTGDNPAQTQGNSRREDTSPRDETTDEPEYIPPVIILDSSILTDTAPLPPARTETVVDDDVPENNGTGVVSTPLETKNPDIPSGTATVLEDVTDTVINRQFITVKSRGGKIYYIIIDNDKNNQNVYFLNAVDDYDLLTLSDDFPEGILEEYEELKVEAAINATETDGDEGAVKSAEKSADPDNPDDEAPSNISRIITVVIGSLFIIGLVYFKVIKPKKGGGKPSNNSGNDDDEEDESQ